MRFVGLILLGVSLLIWLWPTPEDGIQESLKDSQRREWSSGWDGGTHWPTKSNPRKEPSS